MSESVALVNTLGDLDQSVAPGSERSFRLTISESYTGFIVRVPVHVRRAAQPGPTVFVTAALHGNEINGAGAVRQLIQEPQFQLLAGTLVMVPVVNVLGFETYSRYLPDRRDLNRCFPGSHKGSLAARMARKLFDEIVLRCDFGLDLHTAALRRTNFPNVRGDFSHPDVWRLAHAFGCQWMINSKGPRGSLRRKATAAGCPTIALDRNVYGCKKRIGTAIVCATGRPCCCAGAKRQRPTAATAARSKSAWPLECSRVTSTARRTHPPRLESRPDPVGLVGLQSADRSAEGCPGADSPQSPLARRPAGAGRLRQGQALA